MNDTLPRLRPAYFVAREVRATLAGTMCQFRRPIRPLSVVPANFSSAWDMTKHLTCPFGDFGDRLWIKEAFYELYDGLDDMKFDGYVADGAKSLGSCPATATDAINYGVRMQRRAAWMRMARSRLRLQIIMTRPQMLRDMDDTAAAVEGFTLDGQLMTREKIAAEWDRNFLGSGFGWDVNPACWVITFGVVADGK